MPFGKRQIWLMVTSWRYVHRPVRILILYLIDDQPYKRRGFLQIRDPWRSLDSQDLSLFVNSSANGSLVG
jgi:hypothetical protein